MKLRQIKTAVKIIISTAVSKPLRRLPEGIQSSVRPLRTFRRFGWTSSAVFADLKSRGAELVAGTEAPSQGANGGESRGRSGCRPGDKTPPKTRRVRRSEQAASVDGHQIEDLVRHDDPRPAHKHPFAQEREVPRAIMSERDEVAIERRGTGSAVSSGTKSVMFQPRPAHAGLSSSPSLALFSSCSKCL